MVLAVTACKDDLYLSGGNTTEDYGDSYFIIDTNVPPMSRVTYNDIYETVFDEGDIVGVFGLNEDNSVCDGEENVPYAVCVITGTLGADGNITATTKRSLKPATYREVKKNRSKYLFYYPYKEGMTLDDMKNITHTVIEDQRPNPEEGYGKNKAYMNSDLLWEIARPESDGKYCHIVMDHAMANIIVIIDDKNYALDKGVLLNNVNITADGVNLLHDGIDALAGTYGYKDLRSGLQMWNSDFVEASANMFRIAVPAQTIKKDEGGKAFFSVQYGKKDADGNVSYGTKTFNLRNDLVMKPGYNYIFRLSTRPIPIPDYGDEDSWVLDVLDPITGDQVGLLCREYIRYQPQNTLPPHTDNNYNADQITFPFEKGKGLYPNGVDISTAGASPNHLEGLTMSSQAWVFYNMKNGVPDLKRGQILRVIYDLRQSGYGNINTAMGAFPSPYKVENNTEILNNHGQTHSVFTPNHGHNWICDGNYGRSTTDYEKIDFSKQSYYEFWDKFKETNEKGEFEYNYYTMHGSWIWWCPEHNLIYDFKLYDGTRVSNHDAYNYGHIAIPESGEPYVSYTPLDNNDPIRDSEGHTVGFTVPHYLIDTRKTTDGGTRTVRYPLVKIGYNQFWMSRSLKAIYLNDKYNTKMIDYSGHPDEANGSTALAPGYIYPKEYQESRDPDKSTWDVEFLYNTVAILNDKFVPVSTTNGEVYKVPTLKDMENLWNYYGWGAFSKLTTGNVICSHDTDAIFLLGKNPPKSKEEARARGFAESNNGLCSNVSGFNLKYMGFRRFGQWDGNESTRATLLLKPSESGRNRLFFMNYNDYHHGDIKFDDAQREEHQSNEKIGNKDINQSCVFAPVRLFLSFSPGKEPCPGHCSTAEDPTRPSQQPNAPTAKTINGSRSIGNAVVRNVYIDLDSN